jgi:hypothetical protein
MENALALCLGRATELLTACSGVLTVIVSATFRFCFPGDEPVLGSGKLLFLGMRG